MVEEKESALFLETMGLSLESACEEGIGFLERSKGTYESMKILKKDIEAYEKKKKALEQQIEKLRTAFMEYVHSIETIEKSDIYVRAVPTKKLNHSRILKYSHIFMPPSIPESISLDSTIGNMIKKACADYKQARLRYDALQAFMKTELPGQGQNELERKFQIYEKQVNFTQYKLSFSIQTNKLTLSLLKSIFKEVESMEKVSTDHAHICLWMQTIKDHQCTSVENAISTGITKEVATLSNLASEELERHRRKITNEYRPGLEETAMAAEEVGIKRKLIPNRIGFVIQSEKEKKPWCSFFASFRAGCNSLRGSFQVYVNTIIVCEMVFGWKYVINKHEIVHFQAENSVVTIKTRDLCLSIFCTHEDTAVLCKWYTQANHTSRRMMLMGETSLSIESILGRYFADNTSKEEDIFLNNGCILLESEIKEGKIGKRAFLKQITTRRIAIISMLYTELYTMDGESSNPSIIIQSDLKIFKWLPSIECISKIYLRQREENNTTEIYYCFEKSLSLEIFQPLFIYIMHMVIKAVHISSICKEKKTDPERPQYIFRTIKVSVLVGCVSAVVVSAVAVHGVKTVLSLWQWMRGMR
ncbi:hypothetical protein NEAUS05_0798 [Nematocida ausubeli]|nr:hypothetical protein NEAUS05_0798 [Nematocida ausubeli]